MGISSAAAAPAEFALDVYFHAFGQADRHGRVTERDESDQARLRALVVRHDRSSGRERARYRRRIIRRAVGLAEGLNERMRPDRGALSRMVRERAAWVPPWEREPVDWGEDPETRRLNDEILSAGRGRAAHDAQLRIRAADAKRLRSSSSVPRQRRASSCSGRPAGSRSRSRVRARGPDDDGEPPGDVAPRVRRPLPPRVGRRRR